MLQAIGETTKERGAALLPSEHLKGAGGSAAANVGRRDGCGFMGRCGDCGSGRGGGVGPENGCPSAVLELNVGKRAKWVDEKETALRRKEKRCLRCGRDGCWISECPLLPARRPTPPARAYMKKSNPKLPRVEDLVDMAGDSSDQTETDDEELKE